MESAAIVSAVDSITHLIKCIERIAPKLVSIEIANRGVGAYDPDVGHLESAKLQLSVSIKKLRGWVEYWGLDSKFVPDGAILQSIWGNDGTKNISDQLQDLKMIADDIYNLIPQKHEKRRSDWSRCAILFIRKRIGATRSKVRTFNANKWLSRVADFTRHVDLLYTMSWIHFRSVNQAYEPTLRTERPAHFWMNMLRSRIESREFYDFCLTDSKAKYLEIDLLGANGLTRWLSGEQRDLYTAKTYRLFYRSSEAADHFTSVLMRPLEQDYITSSSVPCENFDEAVKLLNTEQQSETTISYLWSNFKENVSAKRQTEWLETGAEIETLESLLAYNIKPSVGKNSTQQLSLSEKYMLSYKIAEFALFFLGTPWVSYLNAKDIKRITTSEGARRYVIEFSRNMHTEDKRRDGKALPGDQILAIGTLLVELALENYSHSSDLNISPDDMVDVQGAMGHKYRAACEYCLGRARITGSGWPVENGTLGAVNSDLENVYYLNKAIVGSDSVRRSSNGSESEWSMVDGGVGSSEEALLELQEFYQEVFTRLNEVYGAVENV